MAATLNATFPFPLPVAAELRVTKLEFEVAVHEQAGGIEMSKLPLPPDTGKPCAPGEIVKSHAVVDVVKLTVQLPAMLPPFALPVSSTA